MGFKCPERKIRHQFPLQTKYALKIYIKMVDKARDLTGGQVKAFQVVSDCEPDRK